MTPARLAFPAMLCGSVALAFGPWLVRSADVPAVASAFWRMTIATLPLALLAARPLGAAWAQPAPSESVQDRARRIIESLDPQGAAPPPAAPSVTRGIRPPASEGSVFAVPPPTRGMGQPPALRAMALIVNFATGSAGLTYDAEAALEPLGIALESPKLAFYRFMIEGHTDTVGSAAMNMELSFRRAAAVREHLLRRFGVPSWRLETAGYGETQLLVSTGDQVPEAANRRVQVLTLANAPQPPWACIPGSCPPPPVR